MSITLDEDQDFVVLGSPKWNSGDEGTRTGGIFTADVLLFGSSYPVVAQAALVATLGSARGARSLQDSSQWY